MSDLAKIDPGELDRYITGNWGEDSVPEDMDKDAAVDQIAAVLWKHCEDVWRIQGMDWPRVFRATADTPGMTQWIALREEKRAEARAVVQYLVDCGLL